MAETTAGIKIEYSAGETPDYDISKIIDLEIPQSPDDLHPFAKILQTPKPRDDSSGGDSGFVDVRFVEKFDPIAWSVPVTGLIPYVDGSYTPDRRFHFLIYSYLVYYLPRIEVKEQYRNNYRIGWPHNLTHQITNSGHLSIGGDTIQSIDRIFLDIFSQNLIPAGFEGLYDHLVGNIPMLEVVDDDWHTILPAYPLAQILPWSYSKHPRYALPLLMFGSAMIRCMHKFSFKLEIGRLLRMQYRNPNGEWVNVTDVDVDSQINHVLDISDPWVGKRGVHSIMQPQMWGRYAKVLSDQATWYRSRSIEIFTEDIVKANITDAIQYDKTAKVELNSEIIPLARAIYFVGENLDANLIHNFSNYTTNSENLHRGWNPIRGVVALKNNGQPRINHMDSIHFDRVEPWFRGLCPPREPGYNSIVPSYDLRTSRADVGIGFSGACTLEVYFADNDPYKRVIRQTPILFNNLQNGHLSENDSAVRERSVQTNNSTDKSSPRFILHVRIIIYRQLIFNSSEPYLIINQVMDRSKMLGRQ